MHRRDGFCRTRPQPALCRGGAQRIEDLLLGDAAVADWIILVSGHDGDEVAKLGSGELAPGLLSGAGAMSPESYTDVQSGVCADTGRSIGDFFAQVKGSKPRNWSMPAILQSADNVRP
jgi:hypothetical protein